MNYMRTQTRSYNTNHKNTTICSTHKNHNYTTQNSYYNHNAATHTAHIYQGNLESIAAIANAFYSIYESKQ